MDRDAFISAVEDIISDVIGRVQGYDDWRPEPKPKEIAERIADLANIK